MRLIPIFLTGLFLRFYKLISLMTFIGDQGWFYISARDALLSGKFPLLGITSSITWLHQGPLYTYLLIPSFALFDFHPAAPAFFVSLLGSITILLLYYLVSLVFNKQAGLISALIFSLTPFVVLQTRMPYHTSLIPTFMCIFGIYFHKRRMFLSGLFLGFLYQLHLLTVLILPIVLVKEKNLKPFILGYLLGIVPFILTGPVQTFGILIWMLKQLVTFSFGYQISDAYLMVLSVPLISIMSWMISRFPKYLKVVILVLFIIFTITKQTFVSGQPLSKQFQAIVDDTSNNSLYLRWWLVR